MKSIFPLIIVFALAVGCAGDSTNGPVTGGTLPADTTLPTKIDNTQEKVGQEVPVNNLPQGSQQQTVSSQGVKITTAPGMKVEDLGTFLLVCSDAVVKDAKCFTLEQYNKTVDQSKLKAASLNNRMFYYSTKPAADGNQDLEGYMQVGNQWYLIKATDKNPMWIFPYLAHVEPAGSL